MIIATLLAVWAMSAMGPTEQSAGTGVSIFGIALGREFTLPKCADEIPVSVSTTCWTYEFPVTANDPALSDSANFRSLHFPQRTSMGSEVTAFVENNITQFFTVETDGVRTQDSVLAQLSDKFGKPTKLARVPVQNKMGAQFVVLRAEWDSPTYFVQFDADGSDGGSHDGDVDKGWVSITTHARHVADIELRNKFLRSQQPL